LYLSRHGIRLDKILKQYGNDPDVPLHPLGIEQIINNSKEIDSLKYIFTSPFLRCIQTSHFYNRFGAPIYIDYGLSETMREKWFAKCGYNPIHKLLSFDELKRHYFSIHSNYKKFVERQSFPETRRESRRRANIVMDSFLKSKYAKENCLLVGHGFSIKDCLNFLGIHPGLDGSQGWDSGLPVMGKLFKVCLK